jgi:hypothetical protein
MTVSQIDLAITNFVNYIERCHERVIGGNNAVEVSITENGVYLKYECPGCAYSYSTKLNVNSPNLISNVNVQKNYDHLPFAPEDND